MNDMLEDIAKNAWLFLAAAFGVTFSHQEYIGGLFFAICGAALAFHVRQPAKGAPRWRFWMVYLAAFVVSTLAAVTYRTWWPEPSPGTTQIVMFVAGFLSRFAIHAGARAGELWEQRSPEKIADKLDEILRLQKDDKP